MPRSAAPEQPTKSAETMLVRSARPQRALRAVTAVISTAPQKRAASRMQAPARPDAGQLDNETKPTRGKRPRVTETTAELECVAIPKKSAAPRKKRNPPPASAPSPSTEPAPPLIPLHTAPELLPATLPFSLPAAIAHLTAADPRFGLLYKHIPLKPFQPPLEPVDPFRTLVTSIIGQQVSWLAARAITGRFRALWGYDGEDGFPTPLQVAKGDAGGMTYRGIGFSHRKAEYVVAIAEHFVSGQLSTALLRDGTDEEIAKALIAVRGIGQWTVDMFLMFSLRRPDILPVGDLGVQKGLLRWALAAHGALPRKEKKEGKKADAVRAKYKKGKKPDAADVVEDEVQGDGQGEIDTLICTPPPDDQRVQQEGVPPTPLTPGNEGESVVKLGALHTPGQPSRTSGKAVQQRLPPTPLSPGNNAALAPAPAAGSFPRGSEPVKAEEVLQVAGPDLPAPTPDEMMLPLSNDPTWDVSKAAPLREGLSVDVLKSRLSGKKVKGGAYLTPREMEVLTEHWRPYRSIGVYYMWPAGEEF